MRVALLLLFFFLLLSLSLLWLLLLLLLALVLFPLRFISWYYRAYFRSGNAYAKQNKWKEAVQSYEKSLTEDRTAECLDALRKVGSQARRA